MDVKRLYITITFLPEYDVPPLTIEEDNGVKPGYNFISEDGAVFLRIHQGKRTRIIPFDRILSMDMVL